MYKDKIQLNVIGKIFDDYKRNGRMYPESAFKMALLRIRANLRKSKISKIFKFSE